MVVHAFYPSTGEAETEKPFGLEARVVYTGQLRSGDILWQLGIF